MIYKTTALKKIAKLNKKIRAVQGGTSASKTISILIVLIAMAQSDKKPTLTSIVSESLPHLKRGVMRDFLNIMRAHNYFQEDRWSRTEFTYTFETGSTIEFFGVDQPDKLRGARRERLFINEANNTSIEAFDQLEVRTKELVFLDWNPSIEFWFYTDLLPNRDDIDHITVTYLDNEALSEEIVSSIEMRKWNTRWWQVYGLGQLGEVENRIYTGWQILDEIPHQARLVRRGLDFGYTNDPSAIVDVYSYNGGFILDEKLYQKGMTNRKLADKLVQLDDVEKTTVIADSSEPKSIDEILSYGVDMQPATKGQGSVNRGINFCQDQRISVTKQSVNLIREYRNYVWDTDKLGKYLNTPDQMCDDHILDAMRYAVEAYKPRSLSTSGIPRRQVTGRRRSV